MMKTIIILIVLFYTTIVHSQSLLNQELIKFSDSTKVKSAINWLSLKKWNDFSQLDLSLKYSNFQYKNFDMRYHPSKVMPKNPFELDYRSNSYYIPRMVKDELNLIMNRPKDNSFVPILGVAFIAAQLATKYLLVQNKKKISTNNIFNTLDEKNILKALWKKNPQTASELYKNTIIDKAITLIKLNEGINRLVDNKLIKQKNLEDKELLFYPAITESEYNLILEELESNLIDSSSSIKRKN